MIYSTDNLYQKVKQLSESIPFLHELKRSFPEGEIYLVGGAVRDFLVHRDTKDTDFLIRKIPASHLHSFLSRYGKVNFVGKNFGVYKFRQTGSDVEIDVALPRTERSFANKGSYRDFEINTDPDLGVEADLERRDFTMNAIAVDITRHAIIDPFDGLKDLEAGQIRAVGNPRVRFSEDYSRLLRGLRFACQFHFQFESETWNALCEGVGFLNAKKEDGTFIVPRETIAKELLRALVLDPVHMFDLWDQSGAFRELIPELLKMKGCPQPEQFHAEGDVWTHTRLALAQLMSEGFSREFQSECDAENALSVMLHDVGKPYTIQTPEKDGVDRIRFNNHDTVGGRLAREIIRRLKLASLPRGTRYAVDEDDLAWLIEKHLILVHGEVYAMRASTIEKYFLRVEGKGRKLMQLIFCDGNATIPHSQVPEMRHYDQLKERLATLKALSKTKTHLPPPLLSGHDVMAALGRAAGPEIGKVLVLLREEQLSGRVTDREGAISFLTAL